MTNGYNVVAFEVHSSTKTRIRYDNVRVEHGTSVPVPVSIVTQPTNTTVIEGGVLSLSVVAAGTPPYTYQWMREGASLPGATNAVYSKSAAMADAGDHTVIVTGAVGGSVTSDVAVVTVVADAFAPVITAQTASPVSAYMGGTLNLLVTASGTEPLAYQWYQIAGGVTNMLPGGTSAAYMKNPVTAGDAGDYFVIVTNGYGSARSSNVTVSVTTAPPPVITAQTPSPVNTVAGVALNLFVTATGNAPLSFQWYKVAGGVTNVLAGATNAAYTKYPAAVGDTGEYFAVVSNAVGVAQSDLMAVSVTAAPSFSSSVIWSWSGAISTTGATVSAKLNLANTSVQLVLSAQPDLSAPVFLSSPVSTDASGRVLIAATGLSPGRRYYYGFRIVATDHLAGRLATLFPAGEPASFTFGFASCSDWGNAATFDAIRIQDPWFFLHTGDLHYNNISDNNPATFRSAYDSVLGLKEGASLHRWMPVGYMWDDHDYGPDNSGASNPSKTAAHAVYRQLVPHWPFGLDNAEPANSTVAIAQSFVQGRVRMVITDCRTDNRGLIDKTQIISSGQLAWLEQQAQAAAAAGQLMFWISSVPWNGAAVPAGDDAWDGAPTQRTAVANALKATGATVVILAGDGHLVAIDDGANADFATGGGMPMPVFQSAALYRESSYKGGPYNRGVCRREIDGDATWGNGKAAMFSLMQVIDEGDNITLSDSGRWGNDGVGNTIVNATHDANGSALASPGAPLAWSVSYPTVEVQVDKAVVSEGDSATVTVTRGGGTSNELVVRLALGGTASGADYSFGSTNLTIPAGAGSVTATLSAAADAVTDEGETVVFSVAPQRGYLVGGSAATVTLTDAPAGPGINTPPQPRAALWGQSVSFTVAATGAAPLTYQWRKDGSDLTNSPTVSGVTGDTLNLAALNADGAGDYSVRVSNPWGTTNSLPATLVVEPPPAMNLEVLGSGGLLLSALTLPTLTYVVEQASQLRAPIPWQGIQTNTVEAGGWIRFTNGFEGPEHYFRLVFPSF
jgi:hypothetical protein